MIHNVDAQHNEKRFIHFTNALTRGENAYF